ncbi:MAG: transcriptional regulator [Firmicutes bacterium]|nr:transcriptional regulator [Bacillota bacterium]
MRFCEKLDFLMNITKTTNSALSLYTSLDASHISRLRRGQRSMPKNEASLKSMAAYFARHCGEEYQQKSLSSALNTGLPLPENQQLTELIFQWLIQEKTRDMKTVESFLDGFSNFKAKKEVPAEGVESAEVDWPQTEISVYYGIEGKRQAVIYFLSEVIQHEEPQTLLLFSDEATDWMTGDREFAAKWASLMSQTLSRGNRIKIIHTVSRNLDEMLVAISQWMPLYMSGAIEPYFYPKKRDGIFKRTLFIAPKTGAVISSSVGNMVDQAANILFRNRKAVESFIEEYNQYLSLCRPLMRIFTSKDEAAYMNTLMEFESEPVDTLIKTASLSILTMPEVVASQILDRYGSQQKNRLIDYHRMRIEKFKNLLQSNSVTDIVKLPDISAVTGGGVRVTFSDMLGGSPAYYTAEEYIMHLENIVCLLETYENFHVCLVPDMSEDRYMVYAKEDVGALVAKTSIPPVILAMNENNMTAAFWDFLNSVIGEKAYTSLDNTATAKEIRAYIQQIKNPSFGL